MRIRITRSGQAGFSLIELMMSVLLLIIVMAAVFRQINEIQKHTHSESMKLDLTQESREFVDQFARDIHMSGYPISSLYSVQNATATMQQTRAVAVGLVYASNTHLIFEGDANGDGIVYRVEYTYVDSDPNDNCPCVRRAMTQKGADGTDILSGYGPPTYYTEVQNVLSPATTGLPIFTYFEANGSLLDVNSNTCNAALPSTLNPPPTPATGCADLIHDNNIVQNIDAIKVTLNTRSTLLDPTTGLNAVNTVASIAELEN